MPVTYITEAFVHEKIPVRCQQTHKGHYGKILLICGSRNYTGAAALSAMGALRSGAGLVYLAVPESIHAIEAAKLLEPVIVPLADSNAMICERSIPAIEQLLPRMDAVLIGCGVGRQSGVLSVLQYVLSAFNGPVVVDADGLFYLSKHIDILRGRTAPTILTPHDGEFARFMPESGTDTVAETIQLALDLNCIVVRKGHDTVISDGVDTYINHTGNAGMATGGSGDVLAGVITSLLGQGLRSLEAAACGVWLHGTSGDICAEQIGQYGMLPQDMLQVLPRLLP